jgi:hypothetical protein
MLHACVFTLARNEILIKISANISTQRMSKSLCGCLDACRQAALTMPRFGTIVRLGIAAYNGQLFLGGWFEQTFPR